MTLDEMQLAVCRKLPHLIIYTGNKDSDTYTLCWIGRYEINWPTEGLQICHEAEKLLTDEQQKRFAILVWRTVAQYECGAFSKEAVFLIANATYEQRIEALCRVWWPERFV